MLPQQRSQTQACQALTRDGDRCLRSITLPPLTPDNDIDVNAGKSQFCAEHGRENLTCYSKYKALQLQLEDLKPPEIYSAGGTGRVVQTPRTPAQIKACKRPAVLMVLQQYYRKRYSLITENLDNRLLVMNRFYDNRQDWGHKKVVDELRAEQQAIQKLLYCLERRCYSIKLQYKQGRFLEAWQDRAKYQPEIINSSPIVTSADPGILRPPTITFMKPMEHLRVQIARVEEEPDPVVAASAARRQELLGDLWFFLKYRFRVEDNGLLDFFCISSCIFRRMVLATPGALVLAQAHRSIRSFLDDENISTDILQELWDLMETCPSSLVWDAITDYRTFINTQFEDDAPKVAKNQRLFILGGYLHLSESLGSPSNSPQISWVYLAQFSKACCLAEPNALARSYRELMVLHQLLSMLEIPRWSMYWELVWMEETLEARLMRRMCTFYDILILMHHGSQHIIRPAANGEPEGWVEEVKRPFLYFQLAIDDPYALPLIKEFIESPYYYRIWVRNARTKEVIAAPENPHEWRTQTRRARTKEGIAAAKEIELDLLADSLVWAEALTRQNCGRHTNPQPRLFDGYYDVLVVGVKAAQTEILLAGLWQLAIEARERSIGDPEREVKAKERELLDSHPFVQGCALDYEEEEEPPNPTRSVTLRRPTTWPKEIEDLNAVMFHASRNINSGILDLFTKYPSLSSNWHDYVEECRMLAEALQKQGIIEASRVAAGSRNIDNIQIGHGIKLPNKDGLFLELHVPGMFCASTSFIRTWNLPFPPREIIVPNSILYQRTHPQATFTLIFLRSNALHWPFKAETPLPYHFNIGVDKTVYTSRYLLKDAPGASAAVHGFMAQTFYNVLGDCVIWRDSILCMRPNREAKIKMEKDYEQGDPALIKIFDFIVAFSNALTHKIFRHIPSPFAHLEGNFLPAEVEFEIHGPFDVAGVQRAMKDFEQREWD